MLWHCDPGFQVTVLGKPPHHIEKDSAENLLQPLRMHGPGGDSLREKEVPVHQEDGPIHPRPVHVHVHKGCGRPFWGCR